MTVRVREYAASSVFNNEQPAAMHAATARRGFSNVFERSETPRADEPTTDAEIRIETRVSRSPRGGHLIPWYGARLEKRKKRKEEKRKGKKRKEKEKEERKKKEKEVNITYLLYYTIIITKNYILDPKH